MEYAPQKWEHGNKGGPHFMFYVRPNYYEQFKCISDRCEATCCAGWQIVIDKRTLKKYKQYII